MTINKVSPSSMSRPTHSINSEALLTLLKNELITLKESEKSDFLKALCVAPLLVLTESDPRRFIRFTNFDLVAAARALANYWKRRREIFGEERAFLPMILTGFGALSLEDIECIASSQMAFLPNDKEGCPVQVIEMSRRITDSPNARRRATFYYMQVISESEIAATKGAVRLYTVCDPKVDACTKACIDISVEIFPVKIKAWHFFNCLESWNKLGTAQRLFGRGFAAGLKALVGKYFRSVKCFVHVAKEEIHQQLQDFGLDTDGLPRRLGGSWEYERFSDWLANRLEQDRQRYPPAAASMNQIHADASFIAPHIRGIGSAPGWEVLDFKNMRVYLLEKSLKLLLQEEEASAYIEALTRAEAQIWEEECVREWFYQADLQNHWLAARRIGRYWSLRLDTFGPSAFKPLNQTGDGALERHQLMTIQNGFAVLLPSDSEGCPVLYIDCSRLSKTKAISRSRDQCLFYMFHLLSENAKSRSKGAVILYKMEEEPNEPFSSIDMSFFENLAFAMPLRIKAVHLLSQRPLAGSITNVTSQIKFAEHTYLHVEEANGQLLARLQAFGLKRDGLPIFANGTWDYAKFIQWKELRTRIEWKIPLGLSGRDNAIDYFPGMKAYEELPVDQKTERYRRLNAIHSRRKRDRKRLAEIECEREQCDECQRGQCDTVAFEKKGHDGQDLARIAAENPLLVESRNYMSWPPTTMHDVASRQQTLPPPNAIAPPAPDRPTSATNGRRGRSPVIAEAIMGLLGLGSTVAQDYR